MNELKEKMNNIHGITLVALVVTIVILLILAGVSISTLTGDDGIIQQSKLATEETSEKVAREEIKRIVTEYELTSRSQTLEEFLKTKIPDRIDSVINNGDGTLTVGKNGYTLTVNDEKKKNDTTDNNKKDDETKQEPTLTVGTAKVVANSDGTGEELGEASTFLGNTLYINFAHSITGGTTTVSPEVPYAVTANGTYNFKVTGTVDGKTYTKDLKVTVNQFKDTYESMQKNTTVKYPDGDVWVPEGFRISTDSASTIQGGVVIEDKDGNQFVWVPVASISEYKRTWYTGYHSFSSYSEKLSSDEQTSVSTYKGFYIGRYEAGDKDSTDAETLRSEGASISNKISIKKGQTPYNFISMTDAKSLAESFGTQQNYNTAIKTRLVSSYAWDTAIEFMQKSVSDYGMSSPQGNYKDVDDFDYIDITGKKQTKRNGEETLIPTGQTIPVCNIYDMGGNLYEWTTESYSSIFVPRIRRGSSYGGTYAKCPASYRDCTANTTDAYQGFRITLFL